MLKDVIRMSNEEVLYSIELITPFVNTKKFKDYQSKFISRLNLLKSIFKGRDKK
jgi:hypothetical protein